MMCPGIQIFGLFHLTTGLVKLGLQEFACGLR